MKILVTGSNGQLGSALKELSTMYSEYEWVFVDIAELDITDFDAVSVFIKKQKFTHVINAAAYTAVDKAEIEKELAYKVNAVGVKNLAVACAENDSRLIHISTDFVFRGDKNTPYKEGDVPDPLSVYGKSKLAGEEEVFAAKGKSIIIRTSWLYSKDGANFVNTIIRLAKEKEQLGIVVDQIGTPTFAGDLAGAIMTILPQLNNAQPELFHYSNEGVASWYDFAVEIVRLKGLDCKILPIETHQYPLPAKRPNYSVMSKNKIRKMFNLNIGHWSISLREAIGGEV